MIKNNWQPTGTSCIEDKDGNTVAIVFPCVCLSSQESLKRMKSHQLLIAAAPELYKACLAWRELWGMRPLDSGADMQNILKRCWEKTTKAIKKAEMGEHEDICNETD